MHEIVKYFILTEIRYEIDRRTLDPLKLIECGAECSSTVAQYSKYLVATAVVFISQNYEPPSAWWAGDKRKEKQRKGVLVVTKAEVRAGP